MENEQMLVDIEKIIKLKSPFLAKILPKFVIRYIKRIVHETDVNYVLSNYGHLKGIDFVNATLNELNISYIAKGIDNIDNSQDARFIFASNHPLGALDGLVLMSAIGKRFNNNVKFVVNDILMNLKPLEPVFIPVNKHGRQTTDYTKQSTDGYASDSQILYFPAGLCSRKIKGKIIDLEWKKNIIGKAQQYHRDIVPVYFSGKNSNFFYRLANIRKKLGIKANLEMFYLSDEFFKQKNSNFELAFGEPIKFSTFDKTKSQVDWINFVRQKTYSLGEEIEKMKKLNKKQIK
ncbi:MAG: 1-acyl-sn-glycerol-3-phosphate acyltransferase [Prevotellaceae bacterium]|jgi:putative hemolysin|nr:1-acyl-sn-glycerol-3-phosphate acyltransferase [Prevotellaceae bacterium]